MPIILKIKNCLEIEGADPELRRYLKDLLTVPNPMWEDAQKFGRYTKHIPRTISQFESRGHLIRIPRGVLQHVLHDLERDWEIIDERVAPEAPAWPTPNVQLRPEDQEPAAQATLSGSNGFLSAPAGSGKALAITTHIPTPTGWKQMGSLEVGDDVLSKDGRPTKVTWVSHIQYRRNYELRFDSGQTIVACEDHLWETSDYQERSRGFVRKNPRWPAEAIKKECGASIKSTKDIAASISAETRGNRKNHSIPVAPAIVLPHIDLPIPPYTLGAWLGDGWSYGAQIYSADLEIIDNIRQDGFHVNKLKDKYGWGIHSLDFEGRGGVPDPNSLRTKLKENNLLRNKHVPNTYKRASIQQRLSLLQGLMDTDGYIGRNGRCELCFTNKRLSYDALEIIRSLGIKAAIQEGDAKLYGRFISKRYRICFVTTLPIFRLLRKKDILPKKLRGTQKWHYITSARKVGYTPLKCIQVEDRSGMFLASESMIPTHNTVIGLEMCRRLGLRALWLTHRKELKDQVTDEVIEHFNLDRKEIGILHGQRWKIGERLTVGMIPTLNKRDLNPISKKFGIVIIDEAHHVPSSTFLNVVGHFYAHYVYGLTATAYRRDRLDTVMFNAIGPKLGEIEHSELFEDGRLMLPTIRFRTTGWYPARSPIMDYHDFMEAMVDAADRNEQIVNDIVEECRLGNICIALVSRTKHAETLTDLLKDKGVNAEFVVSSVDIEEDSTKGTQKRRPRKRKKALSGKLREKITSDFKAGRIQVLVTTYDLLKEGFNYKPLNRLFLVTPVKWKGSVTQAVGRIQRPAEGKTDAVAYDYVDNDIAMFARQADSRYFSVYRELGMHIEGNLRH